MTLPTKKTGKPDITKLTVVCLCPKCGSEVPITKSLASRVLTAGAKPKPREHYQKAGKASAAKRWGKTA